MLIPPPGSVKYNIAFEKGGFREISRGYIKSPLPPFSKGGLEPHNFKG